MNIPAYMTGYNEDYQQDLNQTLRDGLGSTGFQITSLTAAEVATVISWEFNQARLLPPGTFWFNSTLGKMQFITVSANPDTTTDATIETVTSA